MNRAFFLIDKARMDEYGLRPDSGLDEVALIFQTNPEIPKIDENSLVLPVNPEDSGIIMGWDLDGGNPMGSSYYIHMRNHAAVHYLLKNGQSIDADPLLMLKSNSDRIDFVKNKLEPMLDEAQADGKPISAYDYDDFINYVKRETNYFGETTSPVIALALGSRFFGQSDDELLRLGIPLGNYSYFQTKGGLMMDAFDYIAREFPGKLSIEKHMDFLNGFNKEFNNISSEQLEINKQSIVKERLKGVVSALSKLSGVSTTLKA